MAGRLDSVGGVRKSYCMERTIFCVQPFVVTASGLQPGHMRRLLSREAAMRAAKAERGNAAGVIVYSVTGSPEADYWRDPVLLAKAGAVPISLG